MSSFRRIGLASLALGVIAGVLALNPLVCGPAVLAQAQPSGGSGGGGGAGAGTYQIDATHSSLIFKIKHMDVANFYGRIGGMKGSFTLGDTASFDVTVPAEKVDTGNAKRDDHIRSGDFFSAKEFPEMKFAGAGFKKSGENTWKGTGDLTFRGVTKPIELTVTQTGAASNDRGQLAGVETTFTIKRSAFGNDKTMGLSDDVTLIVALEGRAR